MDDKTTFTLESPIKLTLTLESPITDEQWNKITDADFEHTDRIWFETEHGKVEFVKASAQPDNKVNLCDSCKHTYPVCPARSTDVIWGNGTGNDNVCACSEYEQCAQPERKGKWVLFSPKSHLQSCSLCGQWADRYWNYCPNCGAEMSEGEDDG